MSATNNTDDLRKQEYQLRQEVNRLRREVYEQPGAGAPTVELGKAEMELHQAEIKRATAQSAEKGGSQGSLVVNTRKTTGLAGPLTTGLEAEVNLKMAQVPTSICHLFDPAENPLVTCSIKNLSNDPEQKIRRVRVTSYIEGYSARAVDTAEIEKGRPAWEFNQMPTLFPERTKRVTELTRATLNVLIEDLDGRIELQKTKPIWLLARTTAPLAIQDPTTGRWKDMTRYFGAFVTPNAPDLMRFLKVAAGHQANHKLVGYQGPKEGVTPQVEALFNALKQEIKLNYVNSTVAFSPEEGSSNQRVRLPRESLETKQANCIDGTVLFASLLEAISLNPAIVIVPGHSFVGWETWDKDGDWQYLETTMIGGAHTFQQARDWAQNLVVFYKTLKEEIEKEEKEAAQGDEKEGSKAEEKFRLWPLKELRAVHRIMPME